jgi:hypothetical protein
VKEEVFKQFSHALITPCGTKRASLRSVDGRGGRHYAGAASPTWTATRAQQLVDFCDTDLVHTAAGDVDLAILGGGHISYHSSA